MTNFAFLLWFAMILSSNEDFPSVIESRSCVVLDLGLSVQFENKNLIYLWDFGDGQTGSGLLAEHCYDSAGTYEAVLSIIEPKSGHKFSDDFFVEVEIRPDVSLEINRNSDQTAWVGEVKGLDSSIAVDYFWSVAGQVFIGSSLMKDEITASDTIRLLARFNDDTYLSKTIIPAP
ncbi:MAG: PKD domain-containing protein [Cyclobacteriaceae bacterium]